MKPVLVNYISSLRFRRGLFLAAVSLLWTARCATGSATFTTLVTFTGANGQDPTAALVQGTNGNFYGSTYGNSTNDNGATIFQVSPSGVFSNRFRFNTTNGAHPYAGLIQGTDGNFYGTAETGGTNSVGTVFRMHPDGTLDTLYSLSSSSGAYSLGKVLRDTNGNLYGTTYTYGPAIPGQSSSRGTVFKLGPDGNYTNLVTFVGTNGANPYCGLTLGQDGNLYGTTYLGGASNLGTAFQLTPEGELTTLVSFDGTNGTWPVAGLVQGQDGAFYGTAVGGGRYNGGTIFRVTPDGEFTKLFEFDNLNGNGPYGTLIQAMDGNLYGTASGGSGMSGMGTIFRIATNGLHFTTLHTFTGRDGSHPLSGVVRGADGNLYGTAYLGGAKNLGTVFRLSLSRPVLAVLSPHTGTRTTNSVVIVSGRASSSATSLAGVYCRVNGGDSIPAVMTAAPQGWSNWNCAVTLSPGPNQVQTYAVDGLGKPSLTNSITVTYVVLAPVTIRLNGPGTVSPNHNGQRLELLKQYTVTAVPRPGCVFSNWSGGESGVKARLTFTMTSNLDFTASFQDVTRPTLAITYPRANQHLTNTVITVKGAARDNVGVASVVWRLNSGNWTVATPTNNWATWTATNVSLVATNIFQAYAQDAAGNRSLTNSLKFFHP